jgi:antitoxin PrlF
MVTATLTTKGQITIPKSVRDSLHLHSGDRIAFVLHGDSEAVLKPITKSVDDVFGTLHAPSQPQRTVAEMNQAVANRIRSRKH